MNIFQKLTLGTTALALTIAIPVFAEDTSAQTGTSDVRPSELRQDFRTDRKAINTGAQDARQGLLDVRKETNTNIRVDANAKISDIRTSSSSREEKRTDIVKLRADARVGIQGDNASTSEAMQRNHATRVEALKENRDQFNTDLSIKKAEFKKKFEAKRAERKEKLDAKAKVRVEAHLTTIYTRLSERTTKLQSVDEKIAIRMNEAQTKNIDVSSVVTLYASAQISLTKAKTDVEATKSVASEQIATSTSKEIVKELIQTAEASVKASAEAYRKTNDALRAIYPYVSITSSSSATVSGSNSESTTTSSSTNQ